MIVEAGMKSLQTKSLCRPALLAVLVAQVLTVAHADTDQCHTAGRMTVMLSQIDRQCSHYQLSDAGRAVHAYSAAAAVANAPAGDKNACISHGRVALLRDMNTKSMTRLVSEGDDRQFQLLFCEEIATHLAQMAAVSKQPKLYERRP